MITKAYKDLDGIPGGVNFFMLLAGIRAETLMKAKDAFLADPTPERARAVVEAHSGRYGYMTLLKVFRMKYGFNLTGLD